jgi:hypothetical protein
MFAICSFAISTVAYGQYRYFGDYWPVSAQNLQTAVACFDSDVCHGANEPRRTCSDNHLWGAAMFPLILAAVSQPAVFMWALLPQEEAISDRGVLTGLLRSLIN